MSDFETVRSGMKGVFERQAKFWDQRRSDTFKEKPCLDQFVAGLPKGGRVLDLGCGTGRPIAAYVLSLGFDVTGVDFSRPMIEIARSRLPDAEWIVADMCAWTPSGVFDGVIGWDSFFHLGQDQQRDLIGKLADWVAPDGAFMATVGDGDGEVLGQVGGEPVYHSSLSGEEYEALLCAAGFNDVSIEPHAQQCGGRTIFLASGKA